MESSLPVTVLSGFLDAPPYGDRRQEIVFIGQALDEEKASRALDACLLSEKELAGGPDSWKQLPDPFPQWTQEVEEADV